MRIDAVVLAAGASSRLGQPKQSIRVGQESLLTRAVRTAAAAVPGTVHVVVGATDEPVPLAGVTVHRFAGWAEGQHASLCFGLDQLADVEGVLVTPCDQYRVTAAQLRALVAAFERVPEQPAAAAYDGVLGVPVVWPAAWFDTVRSAERGRALLTPGRCTAVPVPGAAYDLDTPDDLQALRRFFDTTGQPPDG